ncbi:adenylate/guanylate cyclase domain-containing protein [Coleofasciculus sp.]|uniref:adenylate/guanylate cyclase domain-containing protein n=1 Tax=Coleofasciculus sp. TaxID=3100458 RepID=UPI0039F9FEC4
MSLTSIAFTVIVLFPIPAWILSPFTATKMEGGNEDEGDTKVNSILNIQYSKLRQSLITNSPSLSMLGLVAIVVGLIGSQYPDLRPWLIGLGLAIGCGLLVRRFLLEIEWKLAAGSVLAAIAQSDMNTPDQIIEQVTRLLYELFLADAAIALRQLDQVTAQALVCFPPTALPDQLTTPKLFAEALTYKRTLFYGNYPATPKAVPVLVAQGTQSLAVLPLRKEQTTQEQGAILLLWYRQTSLPSYQRRFLDLLLAQLHTLLRLQTTTFRLEQLKARYNAILEIPQGVVFVDVSGGQGWLNPAGAKLLGLEPGEAEPSAIAQAMAILRSRMDNQQEIATLAAQLFSQPQAEIHDWIWKFSQPQPLVLSVSSLPTDGQDIQGRLWLFNNITEKYFAQQTLAERTAQLEMVNEQLETVNEALRFTQFSVDRAADAIFWIGQDGRILYVNYAACRLLGYPLNDLLSMKIHDIDANFTVESWSAHWQILKQCGSLSLESHHRSKNGKLFPVEVRISYLEFDGKEYNCAFVRDITERKRSEKALRWEREKAERLLLNILPQPIAERLKQETCLIADRFADVTILFADIVGFTNLSARMPPTQLVFLLNQIFSRFDQLTEKYGLEKIKTIGDAYMIASGIPTPRKDHAEAMLEMALDMQVEIARFNKFQDENFCLRIGINSGPVVAGVIGTKKFIYDLWGDAVNTASRMESHGIPGKIQVTEATYKLCQDKFLFEKRGQIQIKGKGKMTTYLFIGRK